MRRKDIPGVGLYLEMGKLIAADVSQKIGREEGGGGTERAGGCEVERDVEMDADFAGGGGGKGLESLREIGPGEKFAGCGLRHDLVEIDRLGKGAQRIEGRTGGVGAEGG